MRAIRQSGFVSVAPCKRVELSRLRWRRRQSLASSAYQVLHGVRQRPLRSVDREVVGRNTSEREDSPEIERDRSSRPYRSKGKAESLAAPTRAAWGAPGVRTATCNQRGQREQGRSIRFKRKLVGPAKPMRREGADDRVEVRLTDSTPRSGEPATWGSGQR